MPFIPSHGSLSFRQVYISLNQLGAGEKRTVANWAACRMLLNPAAPVLAHTKGREVLCHWLSAPWSFWLIPACSPSLLSNVTVGSGGSTNVFTCLYTNLTLLIIFMVLMSTPVYDQLCKMFTNAFVSLPSFFDIQPMVMN